MNDGNRGCLERFWRSLDTAKGHNQIAARRMSPLNPETETGKRRAVLAQAPNWRHQAPHDLMLAIGRHLRNAS